jgi:[ribosomal protein S18]-alanine N-acetyltransferase
MTPPRIQLRPAVAADLNAILDLERDTATAPHWSRAAYAAILGEDATAPQRCLIVAHDGELPAGFAVGLLHPADHVAELESVVVAIGVRRAGIGRALCTAVFDWCRLRGATEIVLEVRAAGTGAIALYSSLGFTETACRPRYYRDPEDDAVMMRLPLASSPTALSSLPA